jgi:hypothetical protein
MSTYSSQVIAPGKPGLYLVQVVHNFGAAALMGGWVFALYGAMQVIAVQRKLACCLAQGERSSHGAA